MGTWRTTNEPGVPNYRTRNTCWFPFLLLLTHNVFNIHSEPGRPENCSCTYFWYLHELREITVVVIAFPKILNSNFSPKSFRNHLASLSVGREECSSYPITSFTNFFSSLSLPTIQKVRGAQAHLIYMCGRCSNKSACLWFSSAHKLNKFFLKYPQIEAV